MGTPSSPEIERCCSEAAKTLTTARSRLRRRGGGKLSFQGVEAFAMHSGRTCGEVYGYRHSNVLAVPSPRHQLLASTELPTA